MPVFLSNPLLRVSEARATGSLSFVEHIRESFKGGDCKLHVASESSAASIEPNISFFEEFLRSPSITMSVDFGLDCCSDFNSSTACKNTLSRPSSSKIDSFVDAFDFSNFENLKKRSVEKWASWLTSSTLVVSEPHPGIGSPSTLLRSAATLSYFRRFCLLIFVLPVWSWIDLCWFQFLVVIFGMFWKTLMIWFTETFSGSLKSLKKQNAQFMRLRLRPSLFSVSSITLGESSLESEFTTSKISVSFRTFNFGICVDFLGSLSMLEGLEFCRKSSRFFLVYTWFFGFKLLVLVLDVTGVVCSSELVNDVNILQSTVELFLATFKLSFWASVSEVRGDTGFSSSDMWAFRFLPKLSFVCLVELFSGIFTLSKNRDAASFRLVMKSKFSKTALHESFDSLVLRIGAAVSAIFSFSNAFFLPSSASGRRFTEKVVSFSATLVIFSINTEPKVFRSLVMSRLFFFIVTLNLADLFILP